MGEDWLIGIGGFPYRDVEKSKKIFHRPFSGQKSRLIPDRRTRVGDRGKATRYHDSAKQGLNILKPYRNKQ